LTALGVNVLVLDEPTNHLDVWACESLEEALLEYEGTVIVVSHDRYFLNRVVDLLIVLGNGRAQVVHGNYEMYQRLHALQANRDRQPGAAAKPQATESSRPPAPPKPAKRKRQFPYRKVEDLEADIAAEEAEARRLEESLASPDLYRDANKFRDVMRQFEEAKAKLLKLYEHWEEAVELN
jgi:ATP-binding cassette subfamily F protein 3